MTSHSKGVMLKKILEKIKWFITFQWVREYLQKEPQAGKTCTEEYSYRVSIEETFKKEVQVQASSPEEAFKKVWNNYCNGYGRPTKDNFSSVNIEVLDTKEINFYSND